MRQNNMPLTTRLLVSVRDCTEAAAAFAGGADIIDLKEPKSGSLGMANPTTIQSVLDWKTAQNIHAPVSAALGELSEWDVDRKPIPTGLSFVKVGLAGESTARFENRLKALQDRLNSTRETAPQWVTVAYADTASANSPNAWDIARHAVASNSAGLLIDTFKKTGIPLTDTMSINELSDLRAMLNENGQFFAIAGQIKANQIHDCLSAIQPNIIAVRSAVCTDGNRELSVSSTAVAELKTLLNQMSEDQPTSCDTSNTPTNRS